MEISSVGTAIDLLIKASKGLEAVRERAKTSNDAALKADIAKLYDTFLDLKSVVNRLTDEIGSLRQTLASTETKVKPEIRQAGQVNYYFVGDTGPFCQRCYDKDDKLVRVSPRIETFAGGPGRKCEVCGKVYHEQPPQQNRTIAQRGYWE